MCIACITRTSIHRLTNDVAHFSWPTNLIKKNAYMNVTQRLKAIHRIMFINRKKHDGLMLIID
jgi:hypothetical protein